MQAIFNKMDECFEEYILMTNQALITIDNWLVCTNLKLMINQKSVKCPKITFYVNS